MANITPTPKFQAFDNNGYPLVGGKLYTYAAGTTTPLATYTDAAGNVANANPVILDSRGEASVWLTAASYKFKLTTATDVEIWTVDNIDSGVTASQLSASNGSSLIGFIQSGVGAATRTVQSKLRDIVSVKDFGAVGDGVADDTVAIQAALDASSVVYMPKGVYMISAAINVPGQTRLYGDGINRTVIRATASGAKLSNTANRHDNIRLEDFQFDGNNIAIVGITLGVPGSIGVLSASSADLLLRVNVAQCTNTGLVMNYCQYMLVSECIFNGTTGGYGAYINECGHVSIQDCLFYSNTTGLFIGGDQYSTNPGGYSTSSNIEVGSCWFYGPYSGTAQGYVSINNAYNVVFADCTFENEISHSASLIRMDRTGAVNLTGNIWFNNCNWLGISYNTTLIEISYGRRVYFNNCTAIPPNPGYYIIYSPGANSQIITNNCTVNNAGYMTFDTVFWSDSPSYVAAYAGTLYPTNFTNTYQTGTWNAMITDGTNNATMTDFQCNYVKQGKLVTVSGVITTSSLGSVTGDIRIANLPFVISGFAAGSVGYASGLAITAGYSVSILANSGLSYLIPMVWDATTGPTWMQASEWTADGSITFAITYNTTA